MEWNRLRSVRNAIRRPIMTNRSCLFFKYFAIFFSTLFIREFAVHSWCTLQMKSVYFKSAEKIAHMMTPLKFYHKMENDDCDDDNCWKYISMRIVVASEPRKMKRWDGKNMWCVEEACKSIFFSLDACFSFYVKPCSTNHHFSVGHHHYPCTRTKSFVLPTLFWIICALVV